MARIKKDPAATPTKRTKKKDPAATPTKRTKKKKKVDDYYSGSEDDHLHEGDGTVMTDGIIAGEDWIDEN